MSRVRKVRPQTPDNLTLVHYSWEELQSLEDNPLNWKKHPQRQLRALSAEIDHNGWAGALLYNKVTKRLIDGHGRKQLAIEKRLPSIPVLVGNWTEEQEKRLLATLDPIGGMYVADEQALASLTASITQDLKTLSSQSQSSLQAITKELSSYADAIAAGETSPTPLPPRTRTRSKAVPDPVPADTSQNQDDDDPSPDLSQLVFPSSNPFGIPDLHPEVTNGAYYVQPDGIPDSVYSRGSSDSPSAVYCHSARPYTNRSGGGFVSFFTEDWRFEHAWKSSSEFAVQLLEEDWTGIFGPDFSTWEDWPFAQRLWNLYRSRWLSRLWQEMEIPLIPVIQPVLFVWRGYKHLEDIGLQTLLSTPHIPVLGVQCRSYKQGDDKQPWRSFGSRVSNYVEAIEPKVVIFYGGLEHQKKFLGFLTKSPKAEYVMLDSFMGARRKAMK